METSIVKTHINWEYLISILFQCSPTRQFLLRLLDEKQVCENHITIFRDQSENFGQTTGINSGNYALKMAKLALCARFLAISLMGIDGGPH